MEDLRKDEGKFLRPPPDAAADEPDGEEVRRCVSRPLRDWQHSTGLTSRRRRSSRRCLTPTTLYAARQWCSQLKQRQPDFGDMMEELKVKRELRAKEEAAHREQLKQKFAEQKRLEQAALAKEMEARPRCQHAPLTLAQLINKKKKEEDAAKVCSWEAVDDG